MSAVKKTMVNAFLAPIAGFVAMLFLFYAFIQKTEADNQRQRAELELEINKINQKKLKEAQEKIKDQDSVIHILEMSVRK